MKYSVVIPCYNEANNLSKLVKQIDSTVNKKEIEVILVNNGSTDGSEEFFDRIEEMYDNIKTTKVEVNQGYGYGIKQGLKVATGEYMGWIHADMQLEPFNVNKIIKAIEKYNNCDELFIKGKRLNRPLMDRFFTAGMGLFETILFGKKMLEVCSIPVAFHRNMLEKVLEGPDDFSIEIYTYVIAVNDNKKVIHIPVELKPREEGESSWNTGFISRIKLSFKMIKSSFEISKKLRKL